MHQVALSQQQQAEQQAQQQAQAFMSQRANAGPPLAPSNPQPSQPSRPQSSGASYLQKAAHVAARRANWTPSNSIQPLTPQAGVVLTGTASEGEAPPPYRSAPDFPPAAPPFTFLPAPDVPLPPKKSVSFSGGPSVHE